MNHNDNPRKEYQTPANIVSDEKLDHETKMELLERWKADLQSMKDANAEGSEENPDSAKREGNLSDEMLLVNKAIETLQDKANN